MAFVTNGPLRAFRSRDYSLYWIGSVLSISSHLMFFILRGWLALEMTDSAFMVTAVATSGELPQVILSMPGGVLADRMSRKAILIIAEIVTAAILATFAILITVDQMNIWYLFGLTWLLGSVFSLGIPARGAIVPNLVRREDIPNGIALSSIMFSGGMLIGPAIAGWLLATQGSSIGFLAAAAISVFSIAWLIPVRTGQVRRVVDRSIGSAWADMVEGMAYVVRHRVILGLMAIALAAIVFGSPYQAVIPVFARDILDSGAAGLGILGAMGGAGSILGSITVATFNGPVSMRNLTVGGPVAFGLFVIVFAVSTSFWLSAAMALGAGFSFQGVLVASTARVQSVISDDMRGRVAAVRSTSWGAAPLGFLILGAMAEQMGTPTATAVMGAVTLIAVVLVIIAFPAIRSKHRDLALEADATQSGGLGRQPTTTH